MPRAQIPSIALVLSVLLSTNASAETKTLAIERAQLLAVSNSPLGRQIDLRYWENVSEASSQAAPSNPELSIESSVPVAWGSERGDTEYGVSLRKEYLPSEFGRGSAVAQIIASIADLDRKAELLELVERTRLNYVAAVQAKERLDILAKFRSELESLVPTLSTAVAAGAVSQAEKHVLEAELAEVEAAAIGARAAQKELYSTLAMLTGSSLKSTELEPLPTLKSLACESQVERSKNSPINPRIRAQKQRELARRQLELVRKDALFRVTPELSYRHSDAGVDYVGLGLTVPLPILNQRTAEIQRWSKTETSAAQNETQLSEELLEEQVDSLCAAYNARVDELRVYEAKVIPQLTNAVRLYREHFTRGQGTLIQLAQVYGSWIEAEETRLQITTSANQLRSELRILTGESDLGSN